LSQATQGERRIALGTLLNVHPRIDHLLPMSCFDLNSRAQLKLCQSLANLRPAWDIHNWARRNTVTIRDITRYVNGHLALRRYIASQKQRMPSKPRPS